MIKWDYRAKIIAVLWLTLSHIAVGTACWIGGKDTGIHVSSAWIDVWDEMQEAYYCGDENLIVLRYMDEIMQGMPSWEQHDAGNMYLAYDLARYAQLRKCEEYRKHKESKP